MKLNRKWILILSIVLSVAIAAGGTMAYLQDTDEDVNVMTLGNVYIDQIEKERIEQSDDNTSSENVKDFEDDKPLYPYVGDLAWADEYQNWETGGANQLFTDEVKNVVDKFVFVENTGNSDAYVRTWFAFEQGDYTEAELDKLLGININKTYWAFETVANNVEIEGGKYQIVVATYLGNVGADKSEHPNGMLPAGETTRPSLLQVYLDKTAGNEEVENLDSNGNGKYDILVVSQAVQAAGFADAETALNAAFTNGAEPVNFALYETEAKGWFKKATEKQAAEELGEHWDGTVDTTWYNDTDTEFVLTTAEQLAGLAELVDGGNTFEGKTIKLGIDMCFGCGQEGCSTEKSFNPIGHSSNGKSFNGTFDGQDHTLSKLYMQSNLDQNNGGWLYEGEYYGLFAYTNGATIKNVTIEDAYISSGRNEAAGVVGNAVDTAFSDITISKSTLIGYNNSVGGVAAECYGNCSFTNITVDKETVLGPLWGTYDVRLGGIVGMVQSGNKVSFSNVDVTCKLDAINDVAANYQYWLYRYCGMLIGQVDSVNGVADPTGYVTCEDVTVTYGDWVNYHYCEFARLGAGSYNGPGEYKYARVEAGTGTDGIDLSACNHSADESHNVLIVFDQLFGGGQGVKGLKTYDGVTVNYPAASN